MKILIRGVKPCQVAHCPEIDGGGGCGWYWTCWQILNPHNFTPEVPVKEK